MFEDFYNLVLVIILLQTIFIPILTIVSGAVWRKQSHELDSLKTEARSDQTIHQVLNKLPKLAPLKCSNCGGGMLMRETETICAQCKKREALPADYAALVAMKAQLEQLTAKATRHWRMARVLGHEDFVGTFFFAMAIFTVAFLLLIAWGAISG